MRTRLAATVAAFTLAASPAAVAQAAAPDAERRISIRAVEPRDDTFFARGRVRPSYEDRFAVMQRKREDAARWKDWKKFRTDDESRYRKELAALDRVGTVCYRVKVKASGRFEVSVSRPVCIRTFEA